MSFTPKPRSGLGRRHFLAGAGAVGGLAIGVAAAVPGASAARAAGPRPDLMTAALGTPVRDLPHLPATRPAGAAATRAARAAAALRTLRPFLDPLPIPRVLRPRGTLTLPLERARVRLHRALPATHLWTYGGSHLGPTIEVRRGRRLRVAWENHLEGDFPVTAVRVPFAYDPDQPLMWDRPGREGGAPRKEVAALPPWAVVHLHGAVTGGGNDGWAENAVSPGHAQLAEYPNDQPAGHFWYHDHAMHITHLNVMTGLGAGTYLIRDEEEDALGLPAGEHEIPLVFYDRNLDADESGELTGDLLYKGIVVADDPYELVRPFTGPFTLVNGVIWPHLDVEARWYRFRVLNAANNRPYRLRVVGEDDQPIPAGAFLQIGGDAGLLPKPVPLGEGITLTPAERADLLVDFRALRGRRLRLVNALPEPGARPDMMEFRVASRASHGGATAPAPGATLSPSYRRRNEADVADATPRMVVVTPVYPKDPELWEMERVKAPDGPFPIDGVIQFEHPDGTVHTYKRVSSTFDDPVRFTVPSGSTERWSFLSLEKSEGSYPHPMHLHAVAFQALGRDRYDVSTFEFFELPGGGYGAGTTSPLKREGAGTLTPGERGPKDVISLGPGEMVNVAAEFTGPAGRFMHHCHIYEHEDMMMMRPFVIMPPEVLAAAPPGHGAGPAHGR
ncbi:multicopper oxidase family protein [Streptomyces buecherae]|uniref:multicopper oxidase family protein n=1 Tax=Streptomyces buecherae TaxID=2763006 RepID=UPI00369FA1C2